MKSLKNSLNMLPLLLLMLFVSCKKKGIVPDDAKIDLTKYFITWENPTPVSGSRTFNLPAFLVFDIEGKSAIYWFNTANNPKQYAYKLEGDKISVISEDLNLIFTIKEETITSTSGNNFEIKNVKLHKVPATNQLVGKYNGMLNSRLVNTAFPFKYAFNETQFGEEIVAEPTLDYVMTPIKNVYARSYIDNVIRHFLMVDGELIVVRMKIGGTNAESYMYGSLTKY